MISSDKAKDAHDAGADNSPSGSVIGKGAGDTAQNTASNYTADCAGYSTSEAGIAVFHKSGTTMSANFGI